MYDQVTDRKNIRNNPILLSIKNSRKLINLNVFNYIGTKYSIIKQIAIDKLNFQLGSDYYVFMWTDHPLSIRQFRELRGVRINHFPDIVQLTRKNRLGRNLNALQSIMPKVRQYQLEDYNFYPQTWLVPVDWRRMSKKHSNGKFYIVKPQNSCQGKGIYLVDHPNKIDKDISCVVQLYVNNPLLIDKLKFDLRIYALITCISPLRIFLYKEGLARFATEQFNGPSSKNLEHSYTHLTNYAINKNNQNFKVYEDNFTIGHKRLLTKLFSSEIYDKLMDNVSDIVIKSVISVLSQLQDSYAQSHRNDPNSCFQLLGYDILLDQHHKPYLLEINQNPSLAIQTNIDRILKGDLVKDILTIVSGGLVTHHQQCFETKVRNKDKYEIDNKGNFQRIYPCSTLQQTQKYDQIITKSREVYHQKFGTTKKSIIRKVKNEDEEMTNKPTFFSRDQIQKIYKTRMAKTSQMGKR